ncbi:GNAT family acetyltransferase [Sphingomonas oryzagri]|uniref:GNAT family acetyltransferase n=1 Tax=Sphingomonas oryzagri TaxID=3042314 RepID=A0ABT6MZU4_9SPHN|nr:GNAT family acetyltransferase [Sphingomonas oryzagri]MDH7638028.1 GNAT family acetyltransferase [Sphingomonas oryzagri]
MIARLREDEIPAAIALWHAAGLVSLPNDPDADARAALDCATGTILAAHDEAGALTGTVMAGYDGHRGWLYYLASDPARRGEGIGVALVAAAEQWLAEQGARVIRLMVRASNEQVATFYDAQGYERGDFLVFGKRL